VIGKSKLSEKIFIPLRQRQKRINKFYTPGYIKQNVAVCQLLNNTSAFAALCVYFAFFALIGVAPK
jgi:hypothetical protein